MMDTSDHIVIIGASHAGLSCAERLRTGGFDGRITFLDRDPGSAFATSAPVKNLSEG